MKIDEEQYPTAAERLKLLPEPPTEALRQEREQARRNQLFVILAAMAAALAIIAATVAFSSRNEAEDRSARNAEAASQAQTQASSAIEQGKANQDGLKEANRRLAELGKPTVPVPTITVTPEPPPPALEVEGLNSVQSAAVRTIIATEAGRLRPALTAADRQQIARTAASLVPKPADGKTPTAAQLQPLVAASVDAFCVGGRCQGKPGASVTGPPGRPGDTVTGPPGKDAPPVTDEQLARAIDARFASYCAGEGQPCRGATGEQGLKGDTGQDGRSIVDTDCVGEGQESYWRITYDRPDSAGNTVENALGPCRASLTVPTEAVRTR